MLEQIKQYIPSKRRVYVASSWRNPHHTMTVDAIRAGGHDVFDYRNPPNGGNGFQWSEVDDDWQSWNFGQMRYGMANPLAEKHFQADMEGMQWADACVLVLPSGRSAHIEIGWFCGVRDAFAALGATTALHGPRRVAYGYYPEDVEPELMAKMLDGVSADLDEVNEWLSTGHTIQKFPRRQLRRG